MDRKKNLKMNHSISYMEKPICWNI